MPKLTPTAPTTGPALLKSHLSAEGFTSKVIDLNIDLYHQLKENGDVDFFSRYDVSYCNEFFENVLETKYAYVFDRWIKEIISLNPRFVGLSALTFHSIRYMQKVSDMIRMADPNIKIVWGGSGIYPIVYIRDDLQTNRIDYFILGDGEESIVNLLKDNITKGICFRDENNNWNISQSQVDDLSKTLIPDYIDVNWNQYIPNWLGDSQAYVTGSRGCVKRCDFCNVREIWPNYRFRPAANIIEEINHLVTKHRRMTIHFTDSLINGSMKEFRILLEGLVKIKEEYPDFKWASQWIIRGANQCPEYIYELMSRSGCSGLEIGVESFSEKIRYDMGKKFKDTDMWFCFDMIKKYNLISVLLMITGYVTEDDQDHKTTLKVLDRLFKEDYTKNIFFSFGNVLLLYPDDTIHQKYEDEVKFTDEDYNGMNWEYRENTLLKRYNSLVEIKNTIYELHGDRDWTNYDPSGALSKIKEIEHYLDKYGWETRIRT